MQNSSNRDSVPKKTAISIKLPYEVAAKITVRIGNMSANGLCSGMQINNLECEIDAPATITNSPLAACSSKLEAFWNEEPPSTVSGQKSQIEF